MTVLQGLKEKYSHKIKTLDELKAIVGERPRQQKVIMCHGVFDVVHPGHIRHLLYAKSKADILIASLTADVHIKKGEYRPHIPQDLRAVNLAAFEVVDYVLIDENDTPLDNISLLEPDYFAKGYEYVVNGMPNKTSKETSIVEGYGGEIIFTPGDVVYSSSSFINLAAPSIKIEKLLMLMETHKISFDDMRREVKNLVGKKIHIVGDTIVDSYTHTSMIGGQTKTPTISVRYEGKSDFVGGAGIVAKHLRAAGADVEFTTVLGDDELKNFVLADLKAAGVKCNAIIDETRPTTNKNAIVTGGYRMLKIDTLDNSSISDHIVEEITSKLESVNADAVIFSDFRHGIFNKRTIPTLIESIPENAYRVADSQVASRWGNITEFKGFDLITPNEREARFALGDQDSGIRPLASAVYDQAECKYLILKLGDKGLLGCCNEEHESPNSYFVIDSFVENLVDAVGSGDALLAYATLIMLSTNSQVMAGIIGSMAAACLCEQDGNIPITPDSVLQKIDTAERQVSYS